MRTYEFWSASLSSSDSSPKTPESQAAGGGQLVHWNTGLTWSCNVWESTEPSAHQIDAGDIY